MNDILVMVDYLGERNGNLNTMENILTLIHLPYQSTFSNFDFFNGQYYVKIFKNVLVNYVCLIFIK